MDSGEPKELGMRWGPDHPWQGTLLRRMMSGFSGMPPTAIPSGHDMNFLHAVNEHSDWLDAEAVECHIKFSE